MAIAVSGDGLWQKFACAVLFLVEVWHLCLYLYKVLEDNPETKSVKCGFNVKTTVFHCDIFQVVFLH